MGHNIEQGAGGLSFVEIQRFCGICPKTFETDCSSNIEAVRPLFWGQRKGGGGVEEGRRRGGGRAEEGRRSVVE